MDEREKPVGMPLKKAWGGVVLFYAVALALNAAALHRNNEILSYGPVRSFWLAVSGPAAKTCAALGFDRPRAFWTRTAGKALNE
jgi:hypothetical protein